MKRSDMIRIMVQEWLGMFPEHNADQDTIDTVTENMDRLLITLEREGMLPPEHPTQGYEAQELNPTGTITSYRKKSRYWESENA